MLHARTNLELKRRPRFVAVYSHPEFPSCDVVSATPDPPRKFRSFRIAGEGRRRMECTQAYRLRSHKEKTKMATTKKKTAKAVEVDELEDLEALEDLEDGDDEDEAPAPKRKGHTVKPAAKGKTSKKSKGKASAKRGPKPLPEGRLGPADIAGMAGVEARTVRIYLRDNDIEKTDGRYSFTQKQAEGIARKIKARGKKAKGDD